MREAVGAVELAIVLLSAGLHAVWSVAIKGSGDAVVFNTLQCLLASLLALIAFAFVVLFGMFFVNRRWQTR